LERQALQTNRAPQTDFFAVQKMQAFSMVETSRPIATPLGLENAGYLHGTSIWHKHVVAPGHGDLHAFP